MSLYRQAVHIVRKSIIQLRPIQLTDTKTIKRWVAPTLQELYRRRLKVGPEPPSPRSSYLEWNYDAEVYAFGKRLGEEFNNKLIRQALTHRSYVNKEADTAQEKGTTYNIKSDNSEQIQKGGTLISNYVDEFYSKNYPEDVVTSIKHYLTAESMLAHVGSHMGLNDIILTSEFPVESATIANTFKAVVAALEESQNLQRAQLFIKDFLFCQLIDKNIFDDVFRPENPLEYLNNLLKTDDIEPRLCNQSATNTILANYQIGLYQNKKLVGIGWGESIQIAKETAALNAIEKIYSNYNKK